VLVTIETKHISEVSCESGPGQQHVTDSQEHLKAVALRTYSGQKCQVLDEEQVIQLLPMVHKIAQRTVTYLRPPLSFEDLVSAGTIGLLKAARDYNASHHAEFKTYAYIRVKGAILDELRGLSLLPANLNKRVQNALELSRKITERTGKAPDDEQLAEKLGIPVEELYELFENARVQHFISIDHDGQERPALSDFLPATATVTPDSQIQQDELITKLTEAIQQLEPSRRQIILFYYQHDLTMKQIAEIMNITESRVSQLHASALFNLSIRLRRWKDDG
jgi:RNA polymerase sigma factor for flagellar operon FliA